MISNLEPKKVFTFFEEISNIPRESGNEAQIVEYLRAFAEKRNLEFIVQKDLLNVIIKKPGTPGYENSKPVILQGHTDMVCEKNGDVVHDFSKDPIKLLIDGDYITADGTTLGADNGIAVAYGLALLDSDDIAHPPLEILLTCEEETSMAGAEHLDASLLAGKTVINLDSEEEGYFYVSSAGGVDHRIYIPTNRCDTDKTLSFFKLTVKGLRGGHSGGDIHKVRGNANKIIGRVLHRINKAMDLEIVSLSGGSKINAIPREAASEIGIAPNSTNDLKSLLATIEAEINNEFKGEDKVLLGLEEINNSKKILTPEIKKALIGLLNALPNGVHTMSSEIEGLVQSSNNVGVVEEKEDEFVIYISARSSIGSLRALIVDNLSIIAEAFNMRWESDSEYPEWEYQKESHIRGVVCDVYKRMYGKDARIEAIHAGLECGFLAQKLNPADIISLGPDIFDVHCPDEKMSISSTKRVWEFLVEVLKELK